MKTWDEMDATEREDYERSYRIPVRHSYADPSETDGGCVQILRDHWGDRRRFACGLESFEVSPVGPLCARHAALVREYHLQQIQLQSWALGAAPVPPETDRSSE